MLFDTEKIAERIKELRKNGRRVSQKKMATDLMMYQPDISDLENNQPGSGLNDIQKLSDIASYLHVSLEYLLFGNEDAEVKIDGRKEKIYFDIERKAFIFESDTYLFSVPIADADIMFEDNERDSDKRLLIILPKEYRKQGIPLCDSSKPQKIPEEYDLYFKGYINDDYVEFGEERKRY